MVADYKIRFKSFLPGSGKDSAGNPKQGKTRVVGEVSVTDYTRGGEPLAPQDVALTAIDAIHLRVANQTSGPQGEHRREALYNQTDDVFYLVTIAESGISTEYVDEATETVEFVVEGDSSHDAELL